MIAVAPCGAVSGEASPAAMSVLPRAYAPPDVSVIVVARNTRESLRRCLISVLTESNGLGCEIFVVDNGSLDGSPEMVRSEFPQATLLAPDADLGFAAAANLAMAKARGSYLVLLGADASFAPGSLKRAIAHMDLHLACGLGGGLSIGHDGSSEPGAQPFHSILNDVLALTGLNTRPALTQLVNPPRRTVADPLEAAQVDQVSGAFTILRASILRRIGFLDPALTESYAKADLCRRLACAGIPVCSWPDVVLHLAGDDSAGDLESSEQTLGRMRSTLLYYRKQHGLKVHLAAGLAIAVEAGKVLAQSCARGPERHLLRRRSRESMRLLRQAWLETRGGQTAAFVVR